MTLLIVLANIFAGWLLFLQLQKLFTFAGDFLSA